VRWAIERKTTDQLKQKFSLAKNLMGKTAWHDAAETNNTKILDVLWDWVKEELITEQLNNNMFLEKQDRQKTLGKWKV